MPDSDCGCSGSSSTPPGTNRPAASRTVASAFGGNVAVRRTACGPAKCPQPPLSEVDERSPYCPTWVLNLTTEAAGKLLIAVESCLFFLKSKCSGVVWYDAESENVDIRFPDFVSSLPKENNYGFLAKVVPTVRKVCVDGVDTCEDEVHQELAAQVLGQADCGELMLARPPLCGEIPPNAAGNADSQVHVDYMDAPNHEDIEGCVADFRFLGTYMGDRGDANRTPCRKWSLMRRLRLTASQWGFVKSDNTLFNQARQLAVVPVAGGDEDDPCWEMRVMDAEKLTNFNTFIHPPAVSTSADTTAVAIPYDNTIPQSGEGKEYMSITMTPKDPTSALVIEFNAFGSASIAANFTTALFKDADADAFYAKADNISGAAVSRGIHLSAHIAVAGSGPRTYRVRFGVAVGTAYMQKISTGDLYGAAKQAVLKVTEILS